MSRSVYIELNYDNIVVLNVSKFVHIVNYDNIVILNACKFKVGSVRSSNFGSYD